MRSSISRRGRRPIGRPAMWIIRPRPYAGPWFVVSDDYGPVPVSHRTFDALSLADTSAVTGWTMSSLVGLHRVIRWAVDNNLTAAEVAAALEGRCDDA